MSESTEGTPVSRIEQGLNVLFATEVAREIIEAIDFEEILAEQPTEDPVDVDKLANALGKPVGRYLAHRAVGSGGVSGVAGRKVGSEVGGRVAAETVAIVAENVEPTTITDTAAQIDEEVLPGPSIGTAVEPFVDDALLPDDSETDLDDVDAGGDASGVHDTAGDDHQGVLDETDNE